MDTVVIGKRLASLRKAHGMTQKDMANALHVTDKAISKWENGGGLPELSTLLAIADIFDTTLEELLSSEEWVLQEDTKPNLTIPTKTKIGISLIQLLHYKLAIFIYSFVFTACVLLGYLCNYARNYAQIASIGIYSSIFLFLILQVCFGFWWQRIYKRLFGNSITYAITDNLLEYQNIRYDLIDLKSIFPYQQFVLLFFNQGLAIINNKDVPTISKELYIHQKTWLSARISLFLSTAILCFSSIIELVFLFVLRKYGFTFIYDSWQIGLYALILTSWTITSLLLFIKLSNKYTIMGMFFLLVITTGVVYCVRSDSGRIVYYESSPSSTNHLVMKTNPKTNSTTNYHYTFMLFAKPTSEVYNRPVEEVITDWVEDDICIVTFVEKHSYDVYVATYGNRNNGISYYDVTPTLYGKWTSEYEHIDTYSLQNFSTLSQSISVKSKDGTEHFEPVDIKQFGTTAIVLYEGTTPRYVISLNADFVIDNNNQLNTGGSISFTPISNTKKETFIMLNSFVTEKMDIDDITKLQNEQETEDLLDTMDAYIAEDPSLTNFQASYDSVAISNPNEDMFEITKQIVQAMDAGRYNGSFTKIETQITAIIIHAGTIEDYYVEVKYISTYYNSQGPSTVGDEMSFYYRIKQSNHRYLGFIVGYRIIGDLHLKKLDPPLTKEVQDDPAYFYTVP